jgi:hypothetical protein
MSIRLADLDDAQRKLLRELAARYIWWKTPEDAIEYPQRVIAQVMNIGDFDDVQRMARAFNDALLRGVIRQAEIGQFNARSWTYWHYRLNMAEIGEVPPLPARRLA